MDPIANLLSCIRNGQRGKKAYVSVPYSKKTWIIAWLLYSNGYLQGLGLKHPDFRLRYTMKKSHGARIYLVLKPALTRACMIYSLVRVSSPKKRVYLPVHRLKESMCGFTVRILSTTKGFMTDSAALEQNLGGEVICACM